MMKKILLIFVSLMLCGIGYAGQVQTIYSNGTAYLPQECPQGCVVVLTVNLTWKDLDISQGGTGRKIVEEATFTNGGGSKEIRFAGVRITPSFPRGEISIDVKCEIKKDNVVIAKFKIDNPNSVSYNEAISGKLSNLKLQLKNG